VSEHVTNSLFSRLRRPDLRALGRRLAHFWVVWSALLFVHEGGHVVAARQLGLEVARMTVGAGPVVWRGHLGTMDVVLRALPVVGITDVRARGALAGADAQSPWRAWAHDAAMLAGGILATLGVAAIVAGLVMLRERRDGRRWIWGRFLLADALVLTMFNFLPVPPLDGGRAVLASVAAMHGAPLPSNVLFWVQVAGLAIAVLPLTLFTGWTSRIDAATLRWWAPKVAAV
jgi:membrane-associated protease RseP (regulator of RpoE activity)